MTHSTSLTGLPSKPPLGQKQLGLPGHSWLLLYALLTISLMGGLFSVAMPDQAVPQHPIAQSLDPH